MMKKKRLCLVLIAILSLMACLNDENSVKRCVCTIKLNGVIWSRYVVDSRELCFSPTKGYTAEFDCD